jgi:hypothetical protein
MKITKKQIKALDKGETNVRELFPEVFETKLEVGKWYVKEWKDGDFDLFFAQEIKEDKVYSYDNYFRNGKPVLYNAEEQPLEHLKEVNRLLFRLATKEEVETALINEAKRRGFKEGAKYLSPNKTFIRKANFPLCINEQQDALCCENGDLIFNNGVWAEIIKPKTMTKEEIEKELGYEIEIV